MESKQNYWLYQNFAYYWLENFSNGCHRVTDSAILISSDLLERIDKDFLRNSQYDAAYGVCSIWLFITNVIASQNLKVNDESPNLLQNAIVHLEEAIKSKFTDSKTENKFLKENLLKLKSETIIQVIISLLGRQSKSRIIYNRYLDSLSEYQQDSMKCVLLGLQNHSELFISFSDYLEVIARNVRIILSIVQDPFIERVAKNCDKRLDPLSVEYHRMTDIFELESENGLNSNGDSTNVSTPYENNISEFHQMKSVPSTEKHSLPSANLIWQESSEKTELNKFPAPSSKNIPRAPASRSAGSISSSRIKIASKTNAARSDNRSLATSSITSYSSTRKHMFKPVLDAYIIMGMQKFGYHKYKWKKILDFFPFPPYRTAIHLKDRWRTLLSTKEVEIVDKEIQISDKYDALLKYLKPKFDNDSHRLPKGRQRRITDFSSDNTSEQSIPSPELNYLSPADASDAETPSATNFRDFDTVNEWVETGELPKKSNIKKIPKLLKTGKDNGCSHSSVRSKQTDCNDTMNEFPRINATNTNTSNENCRSIKSVKNQISSSKDLAVFKSVDFNQFKTHKYVKNSAGKYIRKQSSDNQIKCQQDVNCTQGSQVHCTQESQNSNSYKVTESVDNHIRQSYEDCDNEAMIGQNLYDGTRPSTQTDKQVNRRVSNTTPATLNDCSNAEDNSTQIDHAGSSNLQISVADVSANSEDDTLTNASEMKKLPLSQDSSILSNHDSTFNDNTINTALGDMEEEPVSHEVVMRTAGSRIEVAQETEVDEAESSAQLSVHSEISKEADANIEINKCQTTVISDEEKEKGTTVIPPRSPSVSMSDYFTADEEILSTKSVGTTKNVITINSDGTSPIRKESNFKDSNSVDNTEQSMKDNNSQSNLTKFDISHVVEEDTVQSQNAMSSTLSSSSVKKEKVSHNSVTDSCYSANQPNPPEIDTLSLLENVEETQYKHADIENQVTPTRVIKEEFIEPREKKEELDASLAPPPNEIEIKSFDLSSNTLDKTPVLMLHRVKLEPGIYSSDLCMMINASESKRNKHSGYDETKYSNNVCIETSFTPSTIYNTTSSTCSVTGTTSPDNTKMQPIASEETVLDLTVNNNKKDPIEIVSNDNATNSTSITKQCKTDSKFQYKRKRRLNMHVEGVPVKLTKEDEMIFESGTFTRKATDTFSTIGKPKQGRRKAWSNSEDAYLLEGVQRYGEGNWRYILDQYQFSNRTAINLKDRYRILKEK